LNLFNIKYQAYDTVSQFDQQLSRTFAVAEAVSLFVVQLVFIDDDVK